MPSNVPPHIPPLRIVGLNTLDAASHIVHRELKGIDTSSPNALYHQASTFKARGTSVRVDITLHGPQCRTYVADLDGPPVYDHHRRHLVTVADHARRLLDDIETRRQAGASSLDYAYGHGQLVGMLGALLEAVADVHGEVRR